MLQVTNQLVTACKDHIKSCTINTVEETDNLWDCVMQEVLMRDPTNTVDPQQKLLKSQVESKLKVVDMPCCVQWQHSYSLSIFFIHIPVCHRSSTIILKICF